MRKLISIMFASLLAIGLAMNLSSCNNESSVENEKVPFLGTWRLDFSSGYQLMTFKANHTGSIAEIDYAAHNWSDLFTWKYLPSSQKLVLLYEEEDEEIDYTIINITANQMILHFDDTEIWYRVE